MDFLINKILNFFSAQIFFDMTMIVKYGFDTILSNAVFFNLLLFANHNKIKKNSVEPERLKIVPFETFFKDHR